MEIVEEIKLTQYSHGGGCGCKIAPQVLDEILKSSNNKSFAQLLVGNSSKDDAAVYQINEQEAIISTTDFFMPIVNDAFTFGKVAAANAISDVYAMGGTPIMALAILGWPINKIPAAIAQQVLEGARAICNEANIPLAGGHSIDSPEPIFGLSVNGRILLQHLKQNNTAKDGDLLLLTKPIGVGIVSTASKRNAITDEDLQVLYQQLTQLNKIGEALGKINGVHALTDVTGFGLAGHLIEMAEGSNLTTEISYSKLPILSSTKTYLAQNIMPDATYRNWNGYGNKVKFEAGVDVVEAFKLLPDPQTNGGLLISVSQEKLSEVQQTLNLNGYEKYTVPIGKMIAKKEKAIVVFP